jgi:hypothetical protein
MTTFYKKVGRKYFPVKEWDNELQDAFIEGSHLIIVKPGNKSYHYNIDPNFVAVLAAGMYAKNSMVDAIIKASELKPKSVPLTEEQVTAWESLKKSFKDQSFSVYQDSATAIAEAGIKALIEEANKLLENPSVKHAYEQFLLVWKLTKDESN